MILESRQDLYHYTYIFCLTSILDEDKLKCTIPVYQLENYPERYISVTRYMNYSDIGSAVRLVLDQDLLRIFGYVPVPVEELIIAIKGKEGGILRKWDTHNQKRITKHNIDGLHKMNDRSLELEYEERFFKDIVPLGKYLKFIDVNTDTYTQSERILKDYVIKYPHIAIRLIEDEENLYKRPKIIMDIDTIRINKEESILK